MRYAVVIERGSESFGAYVPDLPGCVAVASTRDQVIREIQSAIELHLDALRGQGQPIPQPSSTVEFVDVAA